MSLLVNKSKSTISEHIKYLFSNKLINPNNVMEFGNTEQGGSGIYYDYDVGFLLIGRIRNANISKFKEWINDNLIKVKEYNSIDIKKYEIVEFNDENLSLDVNVDYEHDTVWLNRRQIALLFNVTVDNVSFHIKNILACGELDNTSVYEDSSATGFDGKTYKIYMYNFDMILSIGYRVNSKSGILFRK